MPQGQHKRLCNKMQIKGIALLELAFIMRNIRFFDCPEGVLGGYEILGRLIGDSREPCILRL